MYYRPEATFDLKCMNPDSFYWKFEKPVRNCRFFIILRTHICKMQYVHAFSSALRVL